MAVKKIFLAMHTRGEDFDRHLTVGNPNGKLKNMTRGLDHSHVTMLLNYPERASPPPLNLKSEQYSISGNSDAMSDFTIQFL